MSADYTRSAIVASGVMQVVGGAARDPFEGSTNPDGVTWAVLTPTAGRTVMAWSIKNTDPATTIEVGLGVQNDDMELAPGESWSPPHNGVVYVKSKTAAAATYKAVAVEV